MLHCSNGHVIATGGTTSFVQKSMIFCLYCRTPAARVGRLCNRRHAHGTIQGKQTWLTGFYNKRTARHLCYALFPSLSAVRRRLAPVVRTRASVVPSRPNRISSVRHVNAVQEDIEYEPSEPAPESDEENKDLGPEEKSPDESRLRTSKLSKPCSDDPKLDFAIKKNPRKKSAPLKRKTKTQH